MNISIFGLGYVGCVSAACLAHDGHKVIGVDVNPHKVEIVGAGHSPIIETGLDDLIGEMVESEQLRVTLDSESAVRSSDVSVICVGTPSQSNGNLDVRHVETVCQQIGTALGHKTDYHVVIVRSTVRPGTVETKLIPILEQQSGKRAGTDFGVVMNPEFLREGSAIEDYYQPSQIVIGEMERRSGDTVAQMYETIDAPVVHTTIRTAEMVKYVNNAFHALKVTFANEIGNLCKAYGIDGQEVMEMFCQDRRLNISPAYLKPGYAFGGSCLPKDLRALLYSAKERDLELPVLSAVWQSNQAQIQRGIEMVESTGRRKVGVLGISFKAGTDDLRESPIVPLVETLIGRGYQVGVYDEKVELSKLIGTNKSFVEQNLPHIAQIMRPSIHDLLSESEVVVLANGSTAFRQVPALLRDDQVLIDLVGIGKGNGHRRGAYDGIAW